MLFLARFRWSIEALLQTRVSGKKSNAGRNPLDTGFADSCLLEPIREDLIQEHWVERVRRLSMMRIMARRTKAATVLV